MWCYILDSYWWITFWIGLGFNWYIMYRFLEGASAEIGYIYLNVTRNWFVIYFLELDDFFDEFLRNPARITVKNSHYRKFRHTGSRICTCVECEFSLYWMKMCSSYNHYSANKFRKSNVILLLYSLTYVSYFLVTLTVRNLNYVKNSDVGITLA